MTIKTLISVSQCIYKTENSTDQFETGVSKHFFRLSKKKRFIRAVNRLFRVNVLGPMSRMRCTKKRVFMLCHNTERDEQTDIHLTSKRKNDRMDRFRIVAGQKDAEL